MQCTYETLQVYRQINRILDTQKLLCDGESGVVSDVVLLKKSKSEMIDYVNHAIKDKLFSPDDLKAIKDVCIYMRDAMPEYAQMTHATNAFRTVIKNIKLEISPELSLECLQKIKTEFDRFCDVYNKVGYSKSDYLKFIDVLNDYVFFADYCFDALTLYEELKVPVIGLYKNTDNEMVVRGCIDEVNKILATHINDFQNAPKRPDNKALDDSDKPNKLKQAVESVLDKKSKKESKVDDAWVNDVMKKVFDK